MTGKRDSNIRPNIKRPNEKICMKCFVRPNVRNCRIPKDITGQKYDCILVGRKT